MNNDKILEGEQIDLFVKMDLQDSPTLGHAYLKDMSRTETFTEFKKRIEKELSPNG